MEVLPDALEIIFEVQMKRSNEIIIKRNISFLIYKCVLFFPSLWTPLFFKPHNFLISYYFKQFKVV